MNTSEFTNAYYRPATDDIRFTAPILMDVIWPDHGLSHHGGRAWGARVHPWLVGLGAEHLGQARINTPIPGVSMMKGSVYAVALSKWPDFYAALQAKPMPDEEAIALPPPSTAQRLAKLEAQMAMVIQHLGVGD